MDQQPSRRPAPAPLTSRSPRRIVSLLPGATEIVCDLGLADQLVGISGECDQPPNVMDRPRVSLGVIEPGDTDPGRIDTAVRETIAAGQPLFRADAEALAHLQPDLILSQSLCDVCAATPGSLTAEAIGDATVLSLDGRDLDGLQADIKAVADAAGVPERGDQRVLALQQRRHQARRSPRQRPRVLAVEWPEPLYLGGHWVPDMILEAGGEPLNQPGDHSVTFDWPSILDFAPEVILHLPCGMDVDQAAQNLSALTRRPGWPNLPAVQAGEVYLLDSNRFFSRPGPAVFTGIEILAHILEGGGNDPAPGYWRRA
ncbi:MAG: ABC transporter substrate-binding protein [Spiribacter salinus]|uniref:ABC transporter substrate-binding protein n=1 Tax=Spiribacter salinus TaxID=1335746 RepID=A0A540VWF9_9GAMM|nr:MAG: ABC transporter substrate-binding protein [Spiribacter salinus]